MTVSVSATSAQAFAASPAEGSSARGPVTGAAVQPLSAAEVADLERRYPEKAKRLRQTVSTGAEAVAVKIVNVNSGKCLAIGSSSTAQGAHAIQWDCIASSPGQVWVLDGYHILNYNSGLYLAIGSSSTENGAHALQWSYTGSNGQRWYADGDRHLINMNSDKYLAIGSSSTENGAHALQWSYTGSNGQRWNY
ncbi:RICIN domain-containing protein [Thermomonospora umbrina]|uniref:RICIN domain-containing protein n=1 Tax=Thermomonospora umbrina TaxID=111806 RepID=UPI001476D6FC|nr:RICIN domain-containing protein [Thermomonospora umbrina]